MIDLMNYLKSLIQKYKTANKKKLKPNLKLLKVIKNMKKISKI